MKAIVVGLALLVGVSAFGQLGSGSSKAPRRTTRRAPGLAAPAPRRPRADDPLAQADRLRAGTLTAPRGPRSSRVPMIPYGIDPYAPRPTRRSPRLADPYALPRTRTRSKSPSLDPDSPYSAGITPYGARTRSPRSLSPEGTFPRTRTRRADGIYESGLGPSPRPSRLAKPPTFRAPRLETEAQYRARTRPPVPKPAPKPRCPKAPRIL